MRLGASQAGTGRSPLRPRGSESSTRGACDEDEDCSGTSYGPPSRSLCNARPTFEPIITRRKSRRPIFQPKRQKATPTSMKQAMLSTPCTICPPSVLRNAPLLSSTNPVIAPRIMVAPSKRNSIARTKYSQDTVIFSWLLAETASLVPKTGNCH